MSESNAAGRTAKPDQLAANLAVFDFNLSDAEMAEIARLKQTGLRVVNPPHAPRWDQTSDPCVRRWSSLPMDFTFMPAGRDKIVAPYWQAAIPA
jgi:hypothetical protein